MYMTMTVSNKSKQNKISSCGYFLTAATCHHYFFVVAATGNPLLSLSLPLSLSLSTPLFFYAQYDSSLNISVLQCSFLMRKLIRFLPILSIRPSLVLMCT
jgi:hypothetical protein